MLSSPFSFFFILVSGENKTLAARERAGSLSFGTIQTLLRFESPRDLSRDFPNAGSKGGVPLQGSGCGVGSSSQSPSAGPMRTPSRFGGFLSAVASLRSLSPSPQDPRLRSGGGRPVSRVPRPRPRVADSPGSGGPSGAGTRGAGAGGAGFRPGFASSGCAFQEESFPSN